MVMNYLNKVGKYISSHRILFIICVLAAFIIIANIATYFSNYEYYGNCQSNHNSNHNKEKFTSNNNNSKNKNSNSNKNLFMVEQMKNMQNANATTQ